MHRFKNHLEMLGIDIWIPKNLKTTKIIGCNLKNPINVSYSQLKSEESHPITIEKMEVAIFNRYYLIANISKSSADEVDLWRAILASSQHKIIKFKYPVSQNTQSLTEFNIVIKGFYDANLSTMDGAVLGDFISLPHPTTILPNLEQIQKSIKLKKFIWEKIKR